jgi:hypothetical protein
MSKPSPVNPSAAQVRAALAARPAVVARLSEKEQHNLASNGRLSRGLVKAYNKGRKPERQYVEGQGNRAKVAAAAQREALRSQGVAVGKRGPLPKVAPAAK